MNQLTYGLILLILALGGAVVRKTYYYLPSKEVKRRAEDQDPLALQLYRVVAFGSSLRSLLWLYIALTSAAGLVLVAKALNFWVAASITAIFLWSAFSLLPATRITKPGVWLTRVVTPVLSLILNYLHPLLGWLSSKLEHRYMTNAHTGLFEHEDLVELIERQQFQEDNRLTEEELEIVRRAINFGEHKVADVLTSRKKVKTVLATDTVGPVLIDELHKSGQPFVLVRDKKGGQVVGTLAFAGLGLHSSGKVRDLMQHNVAYLNQEDSLTEALRAFFATNQSLFVVVNNFEEFVGIVTIENILKQLLGLMPGPEFDAYADAAAVAARHRKPPAETELAATEPTDSFEEKPEES